MGSGMGEWNTRRVESGGGIGKEVVYVVFIQWVVRFIQFLTIAFITITK